ncbi:MAG: TetR/AcrR family transcriptional regulator [Candidatus Jettenia sp.]|uniref:HTH tetR-type domain-containing protein n=1 Tax=Candidatus Jettenia caeni TaxID=247490 RepID=I3IQ81_9BACT|nr:TetR/AcrR family transcriptional regulator [Candidatus Jettenia sp. AMX1]MBC6929894.1 TetR/AcrR family transcriptional regulator [Candidatus Jettenia sp.]NUN23377.1 TetR/AcrR family transcriptional regulator [Candidatus Jettenia caeni]KAA0248558.1 MAG: TetR/AcrR family transcriptional regulator [Candidatus Jettenia sp. AMX1]MCE7881787.1 TetR/AcrR family transcriptional regulator [Candidatus Jettenia sp. AMX1]MCQ3928173.1 TetR/AcrR family transcriptional regulator [Candidatus Jettenia sp.]
MQVRKSTEIRRQQIIDIIRNIISSKGIEHVTISEIAEEIGTTKGAIYRHFKSKRDILSLLIDDIEKTLMESINSAMVEKDPVQNLKNILLAQLILAKNRRKTSFVVIMGAMQFSDPIIRKKILQLIQKYLRKIEKLLLSSIELGLIKKDINPKTSAMVFMGLIQSTVTIWSYKNFNFVPQKMHSDLWNVYKQGIGV